MNAITHTAPLRTGPATTINRHLKGEWTKLRTLPSTWRTAALTLALGVGFGVAVAFSEVSQWHTMTAQQRQVFDPTSASMSGVMIAAVVLGALAVRTVTAEYSTGMIRSTFSAMPARRLVLAAKAATAAAFAFPVTLLGNVVGFDKTPWPLLLTILNLPQLSIMISLQVSANRALAASDRRAIADHETLIALHEMAKQQLDILNGQDRVLAMLDNFASKDMPGRQSDLQERQLQMQDCVDKILAKVDPAAAAG